VIFVEFWRVWRGLGHVHNYFSKPRGPAIIFPSVHGPRHNLQQVQGAPLKVCGIYQIPKYISTVQPVDRVNGAMHERRARFHGGPKVARTCGTVARGTPGTAGPTSSLVKAKEEEDDEVVLEWWWRGGVMAAEDGDEGGVG
jgi:hypothetical protein